MSHLISILQRSSSSRLLQYSSFCICFLIFSSWIFLARMLGFTSTWRSGFTFFYNGKKKNKSATLKYHNHLDFFCIKSKNHCKLIPLNHPLTLYCSRCLLPFKCISLAFGSLKLHSHSLQWNRITFPSSFLT